MLRKIPPLAWLAVPLAYLLYFFRLGGAGLVGPDEPRYAWIGRAMAQSGDWVTPRLWGEPWFEKPALLYWMTGAAFRMGLSPDVAPRLPVALLGTAFLVFYWWILRAEFGCRAAWLATLILGTSIGWIGFSQTSVPDLPLAVTFGAAVLLALPWVAKRETKRLPIVSALLGMAVLAKGLVPLALAAPFAMRYRWARDWLHPKVLLPFLAIALPWYVLCYERNGSAFVQEFFIRHHFGRFTSGELMHRQPWWFYLTRLPALLLPWAPLVLLLIQKADWYREPRRRFLGATVLFGIVLFSASANKLPGYVLPLLPALAALIGVALDELADGRPWLAACAGLLAMFPIGAPYVAAAAANEWGAAPRPALHWTWVAAAVPVAAAWLLESRGRRLAAVATIAAGAAVGVVYVKVRSEPEMARIASARGLAAEAARHPGEVCADGLKRDQDYGLAYYLDAELPACEDNPKRFHILQTAGAPPRMEETPTLPSTANPAPLVDPQGRRIIP